ncbi:MAG: glycoside hydrolase family 43 protein [Eubacterium sp.]|nr:glycoside hydrolase family 43 protein [Eubacterium sp.]
MKITDINIRDPFVLSENDKYYLYGTRAKDFGCKTGGFDVYTSDNLVDWSNPAECFNSTEFGFDKEVNWAPEVHKYKDAYYMFATFTKENGLRGTFALKADSPLGPFVPHSKKALTPDEWECLDGTLYIDKNEQPYLIFCHEHTQIIDGTICYIRLSGDLSEAVSEPVTLFSGSSPYYIEEKPQGDHYITDGPFMYRTADGELLMIWSTFINHQYAQCLAKSDNGEIDGNFVHLPPLITNDGGHGMLFHSKDGLMLTFHTPNQTNFERPTFRNIKDIGSSIEIV